MTGAQTPGTPVVRPQISGRTVTLQIAAAVDPTASASAFVLYALSDERTLRDPAKWAAVAAVPGGPPGTWQAVLPPVPAGEGMSVIAVVFEDVTRNGIGYRRTASSLPTEFFPVPPFTCELPPWR